LISGSEDFLGALFRDRGKVFCEAFVWKDALRTALEFSMLMEQNRRSGCLELIIQILKGAKE
jgi:hypothetical protein